MKLLTTLTVYEITDNTGTTEMMIIFVRCISNISLGPRRSLLGTLKIVGQGSTFLREVGDELPSEAASYTGRTRTLAFIHLETC